jgi:hypothetical protein
MDDIDNLLCSSGGQIRAARADTAVIHHHLFESPGADEVLQARSSDTALQLVP